MDEENNVQASQAFKEYAHGRSPKIKPPWATIIIVGIGTALLSLLTYIFAIIAFQNPWAMNFLIGLYGIPAGFIIAFRNKTLSFLVSWRYAAYSAMIYTGAFFLMSLIFMQFPSLTFTMVLRSILNLFLTSLLILVYSVVFTFAAGALIGTFVHGVRDDKK